MWAFRKWKVNGIILALIRYSIQLSKLFNYLKWKFMLFTQFGSYFQLFQKFKWLSKFTRMRKYGQTLCQGKLWQIRQWWKLQVFYMIPYETQLNLFVEQLSAKWSYFSFSEITGGVMLMLLFFNSHDIAEIL